MAYAVQATTHHQTYPERPPGTDLPPKKVCNLGPDDVAARARYSRLRRVAHLWDVVVRLRGDDARRGRGALELGGDEPAM